HQTAPPDSGICARAACGSRGKRRIARKPYGRTYLVRGSLRLQSREQRPAETDEERLQRQRRVHVELLRLAPCLLHQLDRLVGVFAGAPAAVGPQVVEAIRMQRRAARACGDDQEIAVPAREALERCEQLLPLRPALRSAHALLGVAARQLAPLDLV